MSSRLRAALAFCACACLLPACYESVEDTNADGVWKFAYDAAGNLVEELAYDGVPVEGMEDELIEYGYDCWE